MLRCVDWELVKDVLGQPIGTIFKGQAIQKELDCFDRLTIENGTDGSSETSVTNYQSTLRNIPEERKPNFRC
jgi:hypothetical protein